MAISDKMQGTINRQINRELYSAYLYLSMAAYCDSVNLKGFSHWMKEQAKEEIGHESWFEEFLGEGPSGHFLRQGETSPFVSKFLR